MQNGGFTWCLGGTSHRGNHTDVTFTRALVVMCSIQGIHEYGSIDHLRLEDVLSGQQKGSSRVKPKPKQLAFWNVAIRSQSYVETWKSDPMLLLNMETQSKFMPKRSN